MSDGKIYLLACASSLVQAYCSVPLRGSLSSVLGMLKVCGPALGHQTASSRR